MKLAELLKDVPDKDLKANIGKQLEGLGVKTDKNINEFVTSVIKYREENMSFETPEIPETQNNYMKLEKGENKFRILDSPIAGFEYWQEADGKKMPVRKKTEAELPKDVDKARYFWALPVYNYATEKIQVLEIIQKTILKEIKVLSIDADWGDPTNYDIVVNRTGEMMETEYSVMPKPAKELPKEVQDEWKELQKNGFNLEALFDNGNPFESSESKAEVKDDGQEVLAR